MNKLKVNTIDFEALIKDLPIVKPLKLTIETSYVFEYHLAKIQNERKKKINLEQ